MSKEPDSNTDSENSGSNRGPNMAVGRDAKPVVVRTGGKSSPNDEFVGKNQPQRRLS